MKSNLSVSVSNLSYLDYFSLISNLSYKKLVLYSDWTIASYKNLRMINIFSSKRLQECILAVHIVLTEIKMKFFDWTDLTKNYEYTYIWWYENINNNLFCSPFLRKPIFQSFYIIKLTLKINFHPFPAIWPNIWVWNSLLPSCYHLLVQERHAGRHFFPSWHQ